MEHKWYVVHTYSGYEGRVETALWDQIDRKGMGEQFSEILVPREQPTDKNGEKKGPARKFFSRLHLRENGIEYGNVAPHQRHA